jgi:hypothetical protein
MKRKYLLPPPRGANYRAPRITSRTLGLRDFVNVAYKSDAPEGGSGDDDPEKKALLEKVQNTVKQEIEARKYADSPAVEAIVKRMIDGLPLDALKAYDADKQKLETSIRNVAGEIEKVKNIRIADTPANQDMMRRAVEDLWLKRKLIGDEERPSELEILMRKKGERAEIVLNMRAAATMTTANTADENGFPLEMIESVNLIDEVVKKRRGNQYVFQVADRTTVDELEQYTSWLEEGNEQGAFAIVAEGAVKPLVSTSLVRNFTKAKKVAGKMVVTEEFTKFRKRIWAAIQGLLRDKLIRDYAALLVVDLQAQAATYVGTSLDDTIVAPNDFDAIGAVAAQIETLNFSPDMIVIHPQDKWRLALQTDGEGRYYMLLPMVGPDGQTRIMGFLVVTSTYQTLGSFTLGESGLFKIEDETITVRLGYGIDTTTAVVSGTTVVTGVASDFDTNKLRLIVETWYKSWIPTSFAGSFVTATFNSVKAALLKP